MVSKLIKFLSGVAALVRKPKASSDDESDMVVLERKYRSLRDTNVRLIQERRELRNQLRSAASKSDAVRGNEYAEELDRAKSFLNGHGYSISRMQVAETVGNLCFLWCRSLR